MLCGKNPALEAVKSAQDALKSAMAGGKAALASVTSKVAELKSKINGMIPQLPSLDSFQAELAGLVGATPDKIAEFKAKWDGKVADLNNLVAKATSGISGALDFCKDVPNVKMDPATGETVEEAKEAQTPNEDPPKPEPVAPTVVDNTTKPSSGNATVVPKTVKAVYEESVDTKIREVTRPFYIDARAKTNAENEIKQSSAYKAMLAKYAKNWTSIDEMLTKVNSAEEVAVLNSLKEAQQRRRVAGNITAALSKYYDFKLFKVSYNVGVVIAGADTSAIAQWDEMWESIKNRSYDGYQDAYGDSDLKTPMEKIDAIMSENSQIAIDYYKYINNIS
jgi:hypothetical protein